MVRDGLKEFILKHDTYIFNEFIKCSQLLSIDEQIHFTDTLLKIFPKIYQDESDIEVWNEIERELYVKYRNKMRYFVTSGFVNLFFRRSEQTQKFLKEGANDAQAYTDEEYQVFFIETYSLFENIKTFLYILDPNGKGLSKMDNESEKLLSATSSGKHKAFDTRPQQVLLMYYITKGLGIKEKIEIPVTKIAEFYHHLLGWEYSDINNSQIYKLLKKAPNIKTDKKQLYKDLLWVKDQIEPLGLISVSELINKELKELEKHIN